MRSIQQRPICSDADGALHYTYLKRRLLDHQDLATDVGRMQMAAIGQRVTLGGIKHVTRGNTDVLGFSRLQHHFSLHHKR